MLPLRRLFLLVIIVASSSLFVWAQPASPNKTTTQACPRESDGSTVTEPSDRRSENGMLRLGLRIRNSPDGHGHMRYCYIDDRGNHAPTLRLQPGDTLILTLQNQISAAGFHSSSAAKTTKNAHRRKHDPCTGGAMSVTSTNLHFHGLAVPPVCHQDETLKTLIEPGDAPFEYRIQIPKNHPPGLYWYHPHVHGFTEEQVLGGASGALVVEGVERTVPRVAGLPERLFVIRDEPMPAPSAADSPDPNRPTKQLTINNIPVPYPKYPPAVIKMKPLQRQFWRVLNAAADTYLDLSVEFDGRRQSLGLVALDGVPVHYGDPDAESYAAEVSHIFLPPATRAEFIITGPPLGVSGRLLTSYVDRGASDDDSPPLPRSNNQPALRVGQDDIDPARPLATIATSADAPTPHATGPTPVSAPETPAAPLSAVRAVRKRTLYFSEKLVDPADPKSATLFYVTEEGHSPTVFDPESAQPNITVHQGDVEDWTIENRSRESHTFHVHQLHFLVIGRRGGGWEEPTLRDTINLPGWDGFRRYPSATLRMDFRDPNIVGKFPFHCHIMQHIDGGMMGTVQIEPRAKNSD